MRGNFDLIMKNLGLIATQKIILAPGFIDHNRDGIGEI